MVNYTFAKVEYGGMPHVSLTAVHHGFCQRILSQISAGKDCYVFRKKDDSILKIAFKPVGKRKRGQHKTMEKH